MLFVIDFQETVLNTLISTYILYQIESSVSTLWSVFEIIFSCFLRVTIIFKLYLFCEENIFNSFIYMTFKNIQI